MLWPVERWTWHNAPPVHKHTTEHNHVGYCMYEEDDADVRKNALRIVFVPSHHFSCYSVTLFCFIVVRSLECFAYSAIPFFFSFSWGDSERVHRVNSSSIDSKPISIMFYAASYTICVDRKEFLICAVIFPLFFNKIDETHTFFFVYLQLLTEIEKSFIEQAQEKCFSNFDPNYRISVTVFPISFAQLFRPTPLPERLYSIWLYPNLVYIQTKKGCEAFWAQFWFKITLYPSINSFANKHFLPSISNIFVQIWLDIKQIYIRIRNC